MLTRTSVVCAESTVATSSSSGLEKSSSACASGNVSASVRLIRRALLVRPMSVSAPFAAGWDPGRRCFFGVVEDMTDMLVMRGVK